MKYSDRNAYAKRLQTALLRCHNTGHARILPRSVQHTAVVQAHWVCRSKYKHLCALHAQSAPTDECTSQHPTKIPKIGPSSVVTSFRDRKQQQKLTDRIHKKNTFNVVSRYNGGDQLASKVDLS